MAYRKLVGRVGDEDEMVIEIGLQPLADIDLDPFGIEIEADLAIGGFGIGDGVDLAQHALAVIVQRAREQLPLGRDRDLVGALRGAQHGDDDADDRDGDDDADRNHHAAARMIAAGWSFVLRWYVVEPKPTRCPPGLLAREDTSRIIAIGLRCRLSGVNAALTGHFRRWR